MKSDLVAVQNISDALWLLFLGICIVWYLRYHWKRRNLYLAAWKQPGPLSLPFLGNALHVVGPPNDVLKKILQLTRSYKSPTSFWMGPKLLFSISKAKDLEIVLNSPSALGKSVFYKPLELIGGQGLFSAPIPRWKRNRKIIMPTLNRKILETFVPVFAKQSDVLLERLVKEAGKGEFNIFDYVVNCITDNLCETVMGVEVNVQGGDSDFAKWTCTGLYIAYVRISRIWYHSDFIFKLSPYSEKFDDVIGKMNGFVNDVIQKKREEYKAQCRSGTAFVDEGFPNFSGTTKKSFLDLLIELSETGTLFTDDELREEVMNFMVAGSDTSSSMISYLFMVLGMYPEIQQKLYEEVIEVLGPNRPVEYSDLKKFVYLNRVLRETLRLFPPAPFVARAITDDIKLGTPVKTIDECTLPAGSSALINIMGLHRDPSVYPEPSKFDPDRFLKDEVAKRHPYSWLPFSGGPRNCIGFKYSYMSNKVVIASVVRKFKFTSKFKRIDDIDLKIEIMLRPTDGYKVSIELRK